MGSFLSTIRTVVQTIKSLMRDYDTVMKRLAQSPGIPRPNSSVPYWTIPPSSIAQHGMDTEIPQHADIVIIGSGITGTSIAKALVELSNPTEPIKIVMLEARDACSGATGRNGGHVSPAIYNEYAMLKKRHGAAEALQILLFRLAHIPTLIAVAKAEGLLAESQARIVDVFDAFLKPGFFEEEKDKLGAFSTEVPREMAEQFIVIEGRDAIEKLKLASSIVGLISKPGASLHPYRLVTGILSNLLCKFSNFHLYTHTPCTGIETQNNTYLVSTLRGQIQAQHVIHATNAWSSHLLPGLRKKIVPYKVYMTAQRPGKGLSEKNSSDVSMKASDDASDWTGSKAFVFFTGDTEIEFDYLTQLLPSDSPHFRSTLDPKADGSSDTPRSPLPTAGEFMFGGGAVLGKSEALAMEAAGDADDGTMNFSIPAYLGGALPMYFNNWGKEDDSQDDEAGNLPGEKWAQGRIKAAWSGIMGLSADTNPWVGRVPPSVSKRPEPAAFQSSRGADSPDEPDKSGQCPLVPPGEWICAGYSGEGMVHAWLSGRALARVVLGVDGDGEDNEPGLPAPFVITEKRVRKANIEDVLTLEDR